MKHSAYFEGKVQSLGINTEEGYATVGVMEPGKYLFSTAKQETMVIVSGGLKAKLPGKDWADYTKGSSFIVAPNAAFEVESKTDTAYICYYK
jgi:uncharacterized protein YaiE (UPF0345 family)